MAQDERFRFWSCLNYDLHAPSTFCIAVFQTGEPVEVVDGTYPDSGSLSEGAAKTREVVCTIDICVTAIQIFDREYKMHETYFAQIEQPRRLRQYTSPISAVSHRQEESTYTRRGTTGDEQLYSGRTYHVQSILPPKVVASRLSAPTRLVAKSQIFQAEAPAKSVATTSCG